MAKKLYNYFNPRSATRLETTDLAHAKRNADIGSGIHVWSRKNSKKTYNHEDGHLKFNQKTKKWKMVKTFHDD